MIEYTVNPIVVRGFSYGNLITSRGLGFIWLKVYREVIRFISPLTKMILGLSGITRTISKTVYVKRIDTFDSRLGRCNK